MQVNCNSVTMSVVSQVALHCMLWFAKALVTEQVGVSLKLQGVSIPNNSLVNIVDLLRRTPTLGEAPSNANGLQTLMCVTDLVDCCESQELGDWYYPNGTRVPFHTGIYEYATFLANRGPNEVIGSRQFYGSVRLWRRWSHPPERGRFRCELPSATDPCTNQIFYVYIVRFLSIAISSSGSGAAGENYSLTCSATHSGPLPGDAPPPTFEWFFGPNGNASLPSGVTPMPTNLDNDNIYTSTLQFSSLTQCHTGNYSCRLGAGSLVNSTLVSVNGHAHEPTIQISTSSAPILGQNGYFLSCHINGIGIDTSQLTYMFRWIYNQSLVGNFSKHLYFNSPLRLSDAGQYTCQVTDGNITVMGCHQVTIQIPGPLSVRISSNVSNPIPPIVSVVTLTCTVELSPLVKSLVSVNTVWTGPARFAVANTAQPIIGSSTTYTSTATISSFGREQSGNYTCTATITPSPLYSLLQTKFGVAMFTVGVYLSLNGMVYANNSLIPITEIGNTSNTGLQCITDRMPCHATSGVWMLPTGQGVEEPKPNESFYRSMANGAVNLYRADNTIMSPTGLFCCEISDATNKNKKVYINIFSVQITSCPATPIAGQNFTLTCNISGAEVTTYRWMKNDTYLNETGSILNFTPLKLSDAEKYTCVANVSSKIYNSSWSIEIQVPGLARVTITSDQDNPIRPVGSSVKVTCTAHVDLSSRPEIDISLTVDIHLTGPTRRPFTNASFGVLQPSYAYANTSSAIISSFGRNDSGLYTCTATISSRAPNVFLTAHSTPHSVQITTGVYLSLRGITYINNSLFFIGQANGLQCITDRMPCCETPDRLGEWYYPDGTVVPPINSATTFYSNRGDDGTVNLSHLNTSVVLPTGLFCCKVPDVNNVNGSHCVNIVAVILSDDGGTPVLGGTYELHCHLHNSSTTTFQWKKDGKNVPSDREQLLSFPKLKLSDAGRYTCIVTVSGVQYNTSKDINVQIPLPASVTLQSNSPNPITIGLDVTLTCMVKMNENVFESDLSLLMVDAQLSRDGTPLSLTGPTVIGTRTFTYTTQLNSFGRNDSGNYTCTATVRSNSSHLIDNELLISGNIYISIGELDQSSNSSRLGAALGVLFVLVVLLTFASAIVAAVRLRKKLNLKPQKPSQCLEDHDHVTHTVESHLYQDGHDKNEEESLELKDSDETQTDKDKSYYFMDTSLIAGERVKPIPVSEFSSHVERLHADRDKLFEMEYESVSKHPQSSYSVAEIPHNKLKNRFANIFPYDSSRVKLKEIAGEDGSDYINASHLDGYNKLKAYIGAQGPMPNTVSDFWRMIWEKKLPTVVMLTRVFEGKKKCAEYWPVIVGESVQPGHGLTITLTSVLPFAEYSLRKMTLTYSTSPGSAPLKVTQYHFTGWPDHGVPQNGVTLINFIKRVRTAHPYTDSRPLLVHCSAGVGRTGAFIVLDSMLQRMKAEENLNIYEFFKQLRAQRVLMVQTQAQYNFIHDALNELILCGDTEITAPNMRIVISRLNKTKDGESGYNKQFNLVTQMSPDYLESDYTQANMEYNLSKNRYPNILPNDRYRVLLRAAAGSDYINASFIDGYRQRGAYIATQGPMENTVNDFWRMIWDYQSRSIVILCKMKEDGKESCHTFLPDYKGDSEVYGKIAVKLVSKETTTDYTIQQLEVSEDKPHPQCHTYSDAEQPMVKVGVFHYLRWPKHGTPRGTSAILELIQYINKTQMTSGNKPITVMCNDGVGRTGTFICIHAQLERLKTEGVVDFFQSIKSARIQRAGLMPEVHQYILCHNLVADYLDGFDTYANFKELV